MPGRLQEHKSFCVIHHRALGPSLSSAMGQQPAPEEPFSLDGSRG